jgi:flagellar capping protein FliD
VVLFWKKILADVRGWLMLHPTPKENADQVAWRMRNLREGTRGFGGRVSRMQQEINDRKRMLEEQFEKINPQIKKMQNIEKKIREMQG